MSDLPGEDEEDLFERQLAEDTARKLARLWVWLCPGAGYAGVGWQLPALLSYFLWFGVTLAFAGFVYTLDPLAGWLCAAGYTAGLALWLVEIVRVWLPSSRPPSPRFLTRIPIAAIVVAWMLASVWCGLGLLNVRSLLLVGGAMTPTARDGERFVYVKRVQERDLNRGAVIVFRTPRESGWRPDEVVVARIAAVPGDRIAISGERLVVNGQAGPALGNPPPRFSHAIAVPAAPGEIVVPANCYFTCSDNASVGFDSRVLGWAERDRIVSARVWYLRRSQLLDRVE